MPTVEIVADSGDYQFWQQGSYAAIFNGTGSYQAASTSAVSITVGQNLSGATYYNNEVAMRFNLSAIPAGAEVTSAQLRLMLAGTPNGNFSLYAVPTSWNGTPSSALYLDGLELGDAVDFFVDAISTSQPNGTVITSSNSATLRNEIVPGSSIGIILYSRDFYNGADPSGDERASFHSANASGSNTRPRLIIEYTVNADPVIGVNTATYQQGTASGPSSTWGANVGVTDADGDTMTVQLRTASGGGGALLAQLFNVPSGTTAQFTGQSYTQLGSEGNNSVYVWVADGNGGTASAVITVRRDSVAPTISGFNANTTPNSNQYTISFTPSDATSTGAGNLAYEWRTGNNGTGTLLSSGSLTAGTPFTSGTITDAGLVNGGNTRYLRIRDRAYNWREYTSSVTGQFEVNVDFTFELAWPVAGYIDIDFELAWGVGIVPVTFDFELAWPVAPATQHIAATLAGRRGGIVLNFRFELRDINNRFIRDITPAVNLDTVTITLNNDRDVKRQATMQINAARTDINPLTDYIAIFCTLVMSGGVEVEWQEGLYALTWPKKNHHSTHTTLDVTGMDLTHRLVQHTFEGGYKVDAGTPYMDAARSVLALVGVPGALPASDRVLSADMILPPPVTAQKVLSSLVQGAGFRSPWAGNSGPITSRIVQALEARAADTVYRTGPGGMLIDATIQEVGSDANIINRVTAISRMPNGDPLVATATNESPESPISTVNIGYIRGGDPVEFSEISDLDVLEEKAWDVLRTKGSMYQTATITTKIDPQRNPFELYELTVSRIYEGSRWYCRNWSWSLGAGRMTHEISREVVL